MLFDSSKQDFTDHPAEPLTTLHWRLLLTDPRGGQRSKTGRVRNKVDRLAQADLYNLMTRQLCAGKRSERMTARVPYFSILFGLSLHYIQRTLKEGMYFS